MSKHPQKEKRSTERVQTRGLTQQQSCEDTIGGILIRQRHCGQGVTCAGVILPLDCGGGSGTERKRRVCVCVCVRDRLKERERERRSFYHRTRKKRVKVGQ